MEKLLARLLRLLFTFKGRITRAVLWASASLVAAVFVVLFVFLESTLGRGATWILYPPFFLSVAALFTKRLHDRARSSWWLLLALIPVVGPPVLFIGLFLRAGTPGDNQYGNDPRLVRADYLTVQ